MGEPQVVQHITVGQKYRIKIEQAASVKGGDGFTLEVNGDVWSEIEAEAEVYYGLLKKLTKPEPASAPAQELKIILAGAKGVSVGSLPAPEPTKEAKP